MSRIFTNKQPPQENTKLALSIKVVSVTQRE